MTTSRTETPDDRSPWLDSHSTVRDRRRPVREYDGGGDDKRWGDGMEQVGKAKYDNVKVYVG